MQNLLSLKKFVELVKRRQNNEFDCNVAVSGARGNGKSSFIYRTLYRFPQFRIRRDLVFSRKKVMEKLESYKFGTIWDDEAVRTGYKRNFQNQDQILLIQMLNMYRDNYNAYFAAIPKFYALDKDLRDLFKIHVHVVKRGLGVIHVANSEALYGTDVWDVKRNQKLEERWAAKRKKNPNFQPPYHKLTTFYGYLKIPKLTAKMEGIYKRMKREKRKQVYEEEMSTEIDLGSKNKAFIYENIIEMLRAGKIRSKQDIINICTANGLKYSNTAKRINERLKDLGIDKTFLAMLESFKRGEPSFGKDGLHIVKNSTRITDKPLINLPDTNAT